MNTRAMIFAGIHARRHFPAKAVGFGLLAWLVVGPLIALLTGPVGLAVTLTGLGAMLGSTGYWLLVHVVRAQGTRSHMDRSSEHTQYAGGVASLTHVQEIASPKALQLKADVLRPSLHGVDPRYIDPTELGVCVVTTGRGIFPGQQVWTTCEMVTLRIGGPRMGKTQSLACHGLDAPGALLTTSTRSDLAEAVHMARNDRAVHIMNPTNYGGITSTVRWSVLQGCRDYDTALRRAGDLVQDGATKDAVFWAEKARNILAVYLHVAALDGRRVADIPRWLSSEDPRVQDRMARVLEEKGGHGGETRAAVLRGHYAEAPNTRKSVVATITPALDWLANNIARDLGDADPETVTLNVERFLMESETLHLIAGTKPVSGVSNLIACIVAEVAYQARQLSGDMPGGRLDPPLTFLLDEAALICPVPLPRWSADMGGRNITMHISIQSFAQMQERWGSTGASTIKSNVGALIAFGGSQDINELRELSSLSGERRVRTVGEDHDKVNKKRDGERRGEWRWVPVLSPVEISSLRPGEVFVRRTGLPTVVGYAPQVWQRKGWEPLPLTRDPEYGTPDQEFEMPDPLAQKFMDEEVGDR